MKIFYCLLLVCFIFISCKSEDSSDDATQDSGTSSGGTQQSVNANTSNANTNTSASQTVIAGLGQLSGALVMDSSGTNVAAANATIEVASHPEYNTTADADGNFEISNMLPGTYTVYAATTLSSALTGRLVVNSADARAAQFKDVVVSASDSTELSSSTVLTEPGTISGTVILLNNPNNVELVGIQVYVPGTSFSATTDTNGDFTLSSIPAGTYDTLRFDKSGLTSSEVEDVVITSGQNTSVGTIYMSLSTGPSGEISSISNTNSVSISGSTKTVLSSNTVTVNLKYDTRAVLMKLAHESSFLNVDWVPVASTYTFTSSNNASATTNYSSDGTKYVYVKFADINGLESSVYYKEFVIDADSPSVTSFKIMDDWDTVSSSATNVYMSISASDSGTGVSKMMFSNSSDFSTNSGWLDYATSYDGWVLSGTSATNTVYVKVKDYLGRESTSSSDAINNTGGYTVIPSGTFTSSLTLKKAQNPFRFEDNLTFEEDLTIEAGITIDLNAATGKTIKVDGRLNANGSSSEPITFTKTSSGFGGFDLSDSSADDNILNYINANNTIHSSFGIQINGGTISNSTFRNTSGGGTLITKTGYKNLMISGNVLEFRSYGVQLNSGTNTTTVYDNYFKLGADASPAAAVVQTGTATGTTITYNTIEANGASAMDGSIAIYIVNGDATVSYNNIATTSIDAGQQSIGIYVINGGTVNASYNNIDVQCSSTETNTYHLYNSSSTLNSDNSYYSGHSTTNPNSTGSPTITNTQGSPWTVTVSGCQVGHNCN